MIVQKSKAKESRYYPGDTGGAIEGYNTGMDKIWFQKEYFGRLEKERYGCNLFEMIQSLSSYSGSEDGEKSSDLNNI